ncbi:MAG TPA: V-type ATPase 116kDa subunit family protein, partial [Nitrososphaera sp.]|nr:V-type ATPase 116kDa subunit family protein [Nitrososphaera sp.]
KNDKESELHRRVSDQLLRVKGLKAALPAVPVRDKVQFSSVDDLLDKAASIDIDTSVASLERQKESLLTRLKEAENNAKILDEFSFFPEDLSILQLSSARSFFGRVESQEYEPFRKSLESNSQDIVVYSKPNAKVTHMVLVVSPRFPSHALATAVQAHKVHLEPVPKLKGRPADLVVEQKNTHKEVAAKLAGIEGELMALSKAHYASIVSAEEQLEIENKKLEVIENLGSTRDAFALEGWIPKASIADVRAAFQKYTEGTMLYQLETEEHPPTLLANPRRLKVFESFVRFYSLPSGDEFDPTVLFGLIFPVFYGLMLGDVGYAVVILLVSRWVIRRVEGGKRDLNIMPKPLRKFAMTILRPRQ